jgi:ABC-type lipoprotein export system ATPase subunit
MIENIEYNDLFLKKLNICLKDRVMGIYGKSGAGKTYALKKIVNSSILKNLNKKIIILSGVEIELLNYTFVLNHPRDMLEKISHLKENQSVFINVCNPNILEVAVGCCLAMKNFILVIDDLEGYLDSKIANQYITNLMSYHRHQNCSVIFSTRRPQSVPTLLTFNSFISIIFKSTEINSLQALAANFPGSDGQSAKHLISNLLEFECYVYADDLTFQSKF